MEALKSNQPVAISLDDLASKSQVHKVNFGLRFKFLALVSLLLLIVVASIATFLVHSNTSSLRANLQSEASSFATLATTPIGDAYVVYKDSGTIHIDQQLTTFTKYSNVISNISIVDLSGRVLYTKDAKNAPHISAGQASAFKPILIQGGQLNSLSQIIYPYFEGSSAHRYSLVYDVSSQQIESQVRSETKVVLIFAAVALSLTVAAMFTVINFSILKPIYTVSRQAARISQGDLEQQIETSGKDEISLLGRAVNTMANSLKRNITQLKELDQVKSEFMIITSHNLRTPLTIISGYTDMKEQYTTIEEYKIAMESISASAKRLNTFAEDMLTISQFELGHAKVFQEPVNITEFIKNLSDDFQIISRQQKLQYTATIDNRPRVVNISSGPIRSAIWNIFDNALKFTPSGGEIHLRLDDDGQSAMITISDTGIGIKPEELPKLFTKFHRGTSVMRYDYEGTGIGLYASKLIVERHGGTIGVSSTEGKGSTFTIKLPLVKNVNPLDLKT